MKSRLPFSRVKTLLAACAVAVALSLQPLAHAAETPPAEVHLDYAYYSPVSLALKHLGYLEKALPQSKVSWVLSQGSNRSLEYLNSGGVDFASSASLAAVLSRANGSPIKSVYVYSRAEWTALVVRKDSPYQTVADLKGKKIAATKGTDPYLFTLRSLQQAGLKRTTSNWCTCNTRTAAPRWRKVTSTPGPASIRTWPPARCRPVRACCTAIATSTAMAWSASPSNTPRNTHKP